VSPSIEFPLAFKDTAFGPISDPRILVEVRTRAGYETFRFLIDTGADFALAPRLLAEEIGLDWPRLPATPIRGVGAGAVPARFGRLPLRIGDVDLTVRCLFVDSPHAMFILGRADFLDRFILTVNQPGRRIILDPV
jgi:hypothetical protein